MKWHKIDGNIYSTDQWINATRLAVDGGASRQGMLLRLQHEHPGTLSHHKARTLRVEWPRRPGRLVVERRHHGSHRAESGETERRHSRLGAPSDHHVSLNQDRAQRTRRPTPRHV